MSASRWVEVWIDEPSRGEYLLLVRGYDDGTVEIIDPRKDEGAFKTFENYAFARDWLTEEEYRLCRGRVVFDWDSPG